MEYRFSKPPSKKPPGKMKAIGYCGTIQHGLDKRLNPAPGAGFFSDWGGFDGGYDIRIRRGIL